MTAGKIAMGAVGHAQLAPGLTLGGTTTLGGILTLPATGGAGTGVIHLGGVSFAHAFGTSNTFLGSASGNFTMTGPANTALGNSALNGLTTGDNNTASGNFALRLNTSGSRNTATGSGALSLNTTGSFNTASGFNALRANTTGTFNSAFGQTALAANTTANQNGGGHTAIGNAALEGTSRRERRAEEAPGRPGKRRGHAGGEDEG